MEEIVKRTWLTDNNNQKIAPKTTIDQILMTDGRRFENEWQELKDQPPIAFIQGEGVPTATTVGLMGQRYIDTLTGDNYICTSAVIDNYIWEKYNAFSDNEKIKLSTLENYNDTAIKQDVNTLSKDNVIIKQDVNTLSKDNVIIKQDVNTLSQDNVTIKQDIDNIQKQVDAIAGQSQGFGNRKTVFSPDGKTITETFGTSKIETLFETDTKIIQKLFENDILKSTKTITFLPNGDITEEVI